MINGYRYGDPSDYTDEEAERIVREGRGGDNAPALDSESKQAERYRKIGKIHRLEPAWTLEELFTADLKEDFIIDQVLIENQPFVNAGEFKTLKTTLLIMLALSLCSGAKFLGRYEVFKRKRVLFCSAESGKRKIRNTIYAVADQMGIKLAELRDSGSLKLSWWVPKISNLEVMDYFKNEIDKSKAEVQTHCVLKTTSKPTCFVTLN